MPQVTIKYFGRIAELLNKDSEDISVQSNEPTALKQELINLHPDIAQAEFQIAINQKIHEGFIEINDGDEIKVGNTTLLFKTAFKK